MEFEQLYEAYFKDVYYYLKSFTKDATLAEELTQETFFKALKSFHQYDGKKDVRAWLFTIGKHTYFTYLKKQKRQQGELQELESIAVTDVFVDPQNALHIHQFLHRMSEPYKEVFTLRVFGELSFQHIGEVFGKSTGWARVTFYRAKQKLVTYMEECEHEK